MIRKTLLIDRLAFDTETRNDFSIFSCKQEMQIPDRKGINFLDRRANRE